MPMMLNNITDIDVTSSQPGFESAASSTELDFSLEMKSASQGQSSANIMFVIGSNLLLEVDDCGYGGGPCSAGATTVLDFMAEVLSGVVTEQVKAVPVIEGILESAPLNVDAESILWIELYMGAFPWHAGVLKTLEFVLSMLQLANKDGRVEEAAPTGQEILSIGRGSRKLDAYVHAILKNMNKMILFSFLPLFLITIVEDELLSSLGLQVEPKKECPWTHPRRIVELMLHAQNMAVDILKYLLVHQRAALEDFLLSKLNKGPPLDVLHGGFDQLLIGNLTAFFEWLHSLNMKFKVLEQSAAIMWVLFCGIR
ncbi:hypothetical protein T459_08882 [Capsicum annuum]|uniref:Uncharacterized protein n=1 Tax=Capsicum annuum TaxID=4072 RepID=A0A2G2ZXT4_CAPAN|nr:hypothetical protein T459_08882 [Capsicum annuum]